MSSLPISRDRTLAISIATIYIVSLFFIWAFATNLIDPLVKSTKVIYVLTDFEAQLNQFSFFIAYGVMSLPAAWFLKRRGYTATIGTGLATIVLGCLIAWITTFSHAYETVLIGLFVSATGMTLLQVAANPLIASMGPPESSHVRLNLSQAFNSMGAYLGGIVGAHYLLAGPLFQKNIVVTDAMKATGLSFVTNVYLAIAAALAVFTVGLFFIRSTVAQRTPPLEQTTESVQSALRSRWAVFGASAIFVYVGAEVCVMSGMILYLEQPQILNVPSQVAGFIGPIFMLMAMVGRFGGSWLMTRVNATTVLGGAAVCAMLLCAIVIAAYAMPAVSLGGNVALPGGYVAPFTTGFIPGTAAIAIGLFNSVMFPTIFTLTLERSTAPASVTSGLMCTAICGGGFISILYGITVDQLATIVPTGARSLAFLVPLACYIFIFVFARASRSANVHDVAPPSAAH